MSKPKIFLATNPFVTGLLRALLPPDYDVKPLHLAPDTGLGGPDTDWRTQLYTELESLWLEQRWRPDVVIVGAAGREDPHGTCRRLLDDRPDVHVLVVPTGDPAEGVARVYHRRSTNMEEVRADSWERVLRVIQWAAPDGGGAMREPR
ncbi:MAG TPA: hypothetical protein VGF55_24310, partial [Gemmataceae bacterium]